MVDPGFNDFVRLPSAPMFKEATGNAKVGHLLWGDGVRRSGNANNGRVKVRARGRAREGWVATSALGGKSLLEVYFIDVGQGDGVLIKTPDFRHILIDGGHPRRKQNTGKSAADFVDWKFFEDYGLDAIELDALLASHNDEDHYGGLADLLDIEQEGELDADKVTVETFYHAGISWWRNPGSTERTLGETLTKDGKIYQVQLLKNRASATAALNGTASEPQLQGEWAKFISKVVATKTKSGGVTPFTRLSQETVHLPGFEPADGKPSIRVLAPVESRVNGKIALPRHDASRDDKTTNGNSILLRLDYGRARILLTGDLNKKSQELLLQAYSGQRIEFQCDVAKACHHGAEDVSFEFLQAMNPAATVISSGDGEGHDHPRPRVVAASGATGHLKVVNDEIITPLVYSTELARSVSLGKPFAVEILKQTGEVEQRVEGAALQRVKVHYTEAKPGDLHPRKESRRLSTSNVVAGLIYGLVNVRTDGETILCATMNEGDGTWAVKSFESRF
jgi:beta-lactamase superfamily II metal-dependent hydrolase